MDNLTIRPYRDEDAWDWMEIHHRAVHAQAISYYHQNILDEWAPPPSKEKLEKIKKSAGKSIRLIAEWNKQKAGFGKLVLEKHYLRACYIHPNFSGKGIGKALVKELENIAKEKGLKFLEFHTSLNAKNFYQSCGFEVIEPIKHKLNSGAQMDAYLMRKDFP